MRALLHNSLRDYLRYSPVQKGKGRLLDLLWRSLSFEEYQRETTLRHAGVRMRCDLTQYLQRHLYFFGGYEDENCALWMERARDAQVIFDIGANVGLYALLAAAANPRAQIHAFEPTPEIHATFLNNLQLNAMQQVHAHRLGVARTTGRAFLQGCRGEDGTNEGMNYVALDRGPETIATVEMVALDDFCRDHEIATIDLLKLDIEGGEYAALLGARRLLEARAIRCMFIELFEWASNRAGHSTVTIKQLLASQGYRLYQRRARRWVPVPIKSIETRVDIVATLDPLESV